MRKWNNKLKRKYIKENERLENNFKWELVKKGSNGGLLFTIFHQKKTFKELENVLVGVKSGCEMR